MGFTTVAVLVGVILGLLFGRPSNVGRREIRWWPALLAGVALQWAPELLGVPESAAFGLVLASYAALLAFGLANLGLVGMPVVLVGLVMNIAVIGANGGMPVRAEAVVAVSDLSPQEVRRADFGSKRHLEGPDDRLTVLGDIVPVPVLAEVLSFGDLVLAFGMGDVVFRLFRPPAAARRRQRELSDAEVAATLAAAGLVIDLADEERAPSTRLVANA